MIDRSFIDLESVVNDIFDRLVKRAAASGLLELTYCIDSTGVRAMPVGQDASRCYDPTDDEYYYDCTIVPQVKIPIGAEFTQSKQASEGTATHITRDALAVATPIWLVGDSIYSTLGWHDHLSATKVMTVASYNARNTDGSLNVEHRVEDCTGKHGEDAQLK